MSTLIIEAQTENGLLTVEKVENYHPNGQPFYHYDILVDGVVRHPQCTVDDALRALGTYLHTET